MCENIFRACHKTLLDNRLIWFQYKILFNILDTKDHLYKLKISDSNLCSFCNQQPESMCIFLPSVNLPKACGRI